MPPQRWARHPFQCIMSRLSNRHRYSRIVWVVRLAVNSISHQPILRIYAYEGGSYLMRVERSTESEGS